MTNDTAHPRMELLSEPWNGFHRIRVLDDLTIKAGGSILVHQDGDSVTYRIATGEGELADAPVYGAIVDYSKQATEYRKGVEAGTITPRKPGELVAFVP
jgi:hypothetical protein